MRRPVVLITGAGGEIGHSLIARLAADGSRPILTLDLKPLDPELGRLVAREFIGSILDRTVLERILSEFEIDLIFHLAALLSTRSEFTPVTAHQVNVEGTLNLLEFAQNERQSHGRPVTFLYPSSIAECGSAYEDMDGAWKFQCLSASSRSVRYAVDTKSCPKSLGLDPQRPQPEDPQPRVFRRTRLHPCMKIDDVWLEAVIQPARAP